MRMALNRVAHSERVRTAWLLFGILLGLSSAAPADSPKSIDLPRPGQRDFVLDEAGLIKPADLDAIRQQADRLLIDKAAPLIVVTVDSLAQHGGKGRTVEKFARDLFNQWQIGPARVGEIPWNYGMLLLVSKEDRKARIELGAGWKHDKDDEAKRIMDESIVPKFREGDFSGGIVAGVESLDRMARGLRLPAAPRPASHYLVAAVVAGLTVFTAVSLFRRGSSGWAWLFWGAVIGVVGYAIHQALTRSHDSDGGGFTGGSFGGGSSGGGGASGDW